MLKKTRVGFTSWVLEVVGCLVLHCLPSSKVMRSVVRILYGLLNSYMGALQEAGAHLFVGHSELNFGNSGSLSDTLPDAVVVLSAIPPDNVEIVHAKSAGIPVLKQGDWLGKLTEAYNLIAVSGSHVYSMFAPSTTTSMIAYILKAMGDDLTAVIGARVPRFAGENVIHGSGLNFILEADEYNGCFLGLAPHITVVTNVDWEHVDIFPDEKLVRTIFRRFLRFAMNSNNNGSGAYSLLSDRQGARILNASDEVKLSHNLELFSESYSTTTYGISKLNEWHASSVCSNAHGGSDYKLVEGVLLQTSAYKVPGVHNVLNSLAVSQNI
ncbi:unnamed protein product [Coffea canephora]|uniref:Mur ligase central domain-containing protein n=1 Tax=Coffea canephora TaxID=49390 RepID=A0A068U9A6_COFCA|nr:unnamed protein product [Coffea canephora]